MPFIAILVDFITLGFYFLQLKIMNNGIYILGLIVQIIAVVFLLAISFGYNGQHKTNYAPEGYRYMTIRYGIIIMSLVINAAVLFLYVLNLLGNNIVFSGF